MSANPRDGGAEEEEVEEVEMVVETEPPSPTSSTEISEEEWSEDFGGELPSHTLSLPNPTPLGKELGVAYKFG